MEREAFRQRMQQYKQARENNPQLKYWDWKKENDLGYQLYKNNLPSNLQVETDDYDLYGAYESNMQPELNEDGTYHLGSRDPYTGRILKSKQHPTYQKAIESEISAGYFPYEKNNITYTKTYSPVDISGYAGGGEIGEDDWLSRYTPEQQELIKRGWTKPYATITEESRKKAESKAKEIDRQIKLVSDALQAQAKQIGPTKEALEEAATNQVEERKDKFYPYKLGLKSTYEAVKLLLAGGGVASGIKLLRGEPATNFGNSAELAGEVIDGLEGTVGLMRNKWDDVAENAAQFTVGELGRRNYEPFTVRDYRTGADITPWASKVRYKGLIGLGILGNAYQIFDSGKQILGYQSGGEIGDDKKQSHSEIPIINFDPKGDPYNPIYGYNPGAGYVSNSDPLGSLYVEGALLNPVFKLAGNAVSNIARGLTKYSSKYVPEVRRTVQDKINSLFRREAEDKARTYKLYDDAIESRNRIIEDLYSNPAYMERARQIQNTYGDNYAKVYEDIINQYNTNYWNLPNPVIKQLDAKAKMQAKDAAVNRYITRRQPAGYDDFEYQINRNLTEIDYPTTRHELGHYVDFNLAKSSNPDYSNSMFAELKRDLSKQKNPLFPDKTDYYSKGTEQKSYMNTLREYMFKNGMINNIGDKVTSRQIKKAIRSLPKDMRSIEAAYLQFATPGQYTKWFNKIPLLGTYPIVNKQFQNYEEDKDKARKQR